MRVTDEMVLAGAREVCARWSAACGVDPEDNWKIYSDEHKAEARAILEAALSHAAGQDGEQCRAASGVEEVARQMDAMAEHIQASSPEQKAERLRGWASMLRALSRGVPEGDDSLPRPLWPVSKEWYRLCERRFAVDRITISGKLAEAIVDAVCGPAIAAQRKEG